VGIVDVKAILMIGGRSGDASALSPVETVAGVPIAFLDALGLPVVERVLQRLQQFGVSGVTLVSDAPAEAEPFARHATLRPDIPCIQARGSGFWNAAEETFTKYAQDGAELVIVLRVGAYAEIDYEELIQHHLDKRCRITSAVDTNQVPLEVFVITVSRRKDASVLFQSQLQKLRTGCEDFRFTGYVNRLQTSRDLRCLAMDGLLQNNAIHPFGRETKPGVWIGEGARVHRKARVVAPAFIGAYARVRAAALITRNTVIEHHGEVDCGTVVENSTLLPYTYVGAGLDIMHSIVGLHRITNMVRNVEVEIHDAKLVGMSAVNPLFRAAGSAAALIAFLPKQIYRGLSAPLRSKSAADTPESLDPAATGLETNFVESSGGSGSEASTFPDNFAVARRYGDQQ
jgi:NDP-sugar pyrophosphorylase family protein